MWANKYIGKPFAPRGRGPEEYDCWGLAMQVYKTDHPKKIILPGYEDLYENTEDKEAIRDILLAHRERWREVVHPGAFDLALLSFMGVPMHVAIVTRPGYMLHCDRGPGTTHERYTSMRWEHKVKGFFRYE